MHLICRDNNNYYNYYNSNDDVFVQAISWDYYKRAKLQILIRSDSEILAYCY